MSELIGWSSRRVCYTKEQIEFLKEIKAINRGSIYAAVVCATSEPMFKDMDVMDVVRFAEDCEKMLAEWDKVRGEFVTIGSPS